MAMMGRKTTICSVFEDFNISHRAKFVVLAVRQDGKWIFIKQKGRDTFEMPRGVIRNGENVFSLACRELYEKTGVVAGKLYPVCAYSVSTGSGRISAAGRHVTYGRLFYVDVMCKSKQPKHETGEVCYFKELPDVKSLTYPEIHPRLYLKVQSWLEKNEIEKQMPYCFEKVCGAVTFCLRNNVPYYVLIKNLSGHIGYPKGHVEDGESEIETVRREVFEETSLSPKIYDDFRYSFQYIAPDKGCKMHKTAVYYISQFNESEASMHMQETEILESWLVPLKDALLLLNKENDRTLLVQANSWITQNIIEKQ